MERQGKIIVVIAMLALACGVAVGGDGKGDAAASSVPSRKTAQAAHNWAPPDIDEDVPTVDSSRECPLPAVLKEAGRRARELVSSLPKFAATEHLEHYEADKHGNWGKAQALDFEYVVEMHHVRKGMLVMDETRDRTHSLERFPARIATLGLPAIAMVFHPYFVDEYDMRCEGMAKIDGYDAWQIHFQQRPDRFARLRAYRIGAQTFPIKLKGRAWIDAATFQVLRIETDLLQPVRVIELKREHLTVDYRPVKFRKDNEELWLQQSAEVYMDYRGHRYRRRHTFDHFMLFAVDVGQTVKDPTISSEAQK